MINENDFEKVGREIKAQLITIRESIGASVADYSPPHIGIEIRGAELQKIAEKNPDEPIIRDGKYYFVYIKNHDYHSNRNDRQYDIDSIHTHPTGCFCGGNKIHFYNCRTLVDMGHANRMGNYFYISEDYNEFWDNNKLPIDYGAKKKNVRLAYCKWCIGILSKDLPRYKKEVIAEYSDANPLMDAVKAYHENENVVKVQDFIEQTIRRANNA